ncbi:hypothetical protein [Leisingera sp. ANG59]|uniref:hypothetical protein n=1 Tax=Leisingera sp. ANG59 TaxID=2675221 RepID=UPI0019E227B4|nr:hypothetical protein [Leisingera sp. ANG59]NSY38617.1 hypothetical protein [Leisingera sp. ANG59]
MVPILGILGLGLSLIPGFESAIPGFGSVDKGAESVGKRCGDLIWGFWVGIAVFGVAAGGSVFLTLFCCKVLILFDL